MTTDYRLLTTDYQRGQTLFELVIALAVVVLVITGIVHVVTTAIKNSTFARNKSEATRYAQETLEWVKAERDKRSWSDFIGKVPASKTCIPTLCWPGDSGCTAVTTACDSGSDSQKILGTIFFREITFSQSGTTCLVTATTCNANVAIFWLDVDTTHTSTLETRVTNWKEAQ